MNTFSDFLQNGNPSGLVLLYGNTKDQILSSDLCFRSFFVALADMLHEAGFDNVVFFDSTNAMGKFVYDDDSAYYSITDAREPYVQKYGHPPVHSGAVSSQGVSTDPKPAQTAPRGGMTFGKPRKPVSAPQSAIPAANVSAGAETTGVTQMPYQQKNMQESVFYAECGRLMDNEEFRSAVVFTNFNTFLRYSQVRTQYAETFLSYMPSRGGQGNLMIAVHPDLQNPSDKEFCHLLQDASLLYYFMVSVGRGKEQQYVPNTSRCFFIDTVGLDELKNLLLYYKLFQGLLLPEGVETTADKLFYVLRQAEGLYHHPFTLHSVRNAMDAYLQNAPITEVNDDFYLAVSGLDVSEVDFDPWNTLRTTRGWEPAADKLNECLEPLRQQRPEVSQEKPCLFTARIAGRRPSAYPNAKDMPHFILEGSPGTGKTTIAKLIGRILHDEGLLETGAVLQASKADCIADVIGGTAIKMNALIDHAEGGVLFIDEAHSLCEDYEKDGNADSFALEAVHTLVNAMTDEKRHFCVVLAGYKCSRPGSTDGVRGLFKMDPGLESRLVRGGIITLEDYTPDLLTSVFVKELEKAGIGLEGDVSKENISTLMDNAYQSRNRRTFGNARFAVSLAQKVIGNVRRRCDDQRPLNAARSDFGDQENLLDKIDIDTIKQELTRYPGLGEIGNRIIDDYMNYREVQADIAGGYEKVRNPKHMVFLGNPGTGKTTIAKILCKALAAAHIFGGTNPVEINNADTIELNKLQKHIRDAISFNSALFVDEAHNCRSEVIHTLLNPMSENSQLTCIFAVYRSKEKHFFNLDPGLRDRCKVYLIDDYTPAQLLDIFQKYAEDDHWTCDPDCLKQLQVLFQNWYDTREAVQDYSNARAVKNLYDEMLLKSYERSKKNPKEKRHTFIAEDIPEAEKGLISAQGGFTDFEAVMAELNTYVGLNPLKEWLCAQNEVHGYAERYKTSVVPAGHMLFCGEPGTGKTTAGRLFAEACYQLGIIKARKFMKYEAKDLIAGYIGQTSLKTADALNAGRDGVIFIDEAYNLSTGAMMGGGDSFKDDVISLLLTFTEEEYGKTIVILAGYEDLMDQFLKSNPGLQSRFGTKILFPNYNAEECTEILRRMLKNNGGYQMSNTADDLALRSFKTIAALPEFGNARDVRTISERILEAHMLRLMKDEQFSGNYQEITDDDVEQGLNKWSLARSNSNKVF